MRAADSAAVERVMPHSLDAEKSVLGAVLLRNQVLDDVLPVLHPDDFYREAHRVIFGAMATLADRREPIDLLTLRELLTGTGKLDEIGGAAYLTRLVAGVPHTTNVAHYAEIVREKAMRRALIHETAQIMESAFDPDGTAADVLNDAERRIFGLSQAQTSNDLVPASVMVPRLMPVLERMIESKGRGVTGLSTGFVDLDRITCGLQAGQLIVLGGRPSQGKTSLAQDIARHVAIRQQQPVAFFSLETSETALMLRQLIAEAPIDSHRLRSGFISSEAYGRIVNAMGRLESAPFYLDESPVLRPMDVLSRCRRMKARVGLSLAIVDFIQLMTPDRGTSADNRQVELGSISRAMKRVAKELGIPLIVLAALNREVEKRSDKRPMMSDLRESGQLESDADVVMLIHRPGAYDQDDPSKQGYIELDIAKQKDLPTAVIRLAWIPESARCENYTEGGV